MSKAKLAQLDAAEDEVLSLMEIARQSAEELGKIPMDVEQVALLAKSFADGVEGLRGNLLDQAKDLKPLSSNARTNYAKQEKEH